MPAFTEKLVWDYSLQSWVKDMHFMFHMTISKT